MEKQAGSIVALDTNSGQTIKVPLKTNTPCTFGSSLSATVRVVVDKMPSNDIYCRIDVDDKGFAVLASKTKLHPVSLNGKALLHEKVLVNNDIFEMFDRKFQYINSRMTEEKAKLYRRKKNQIFPWHTPLKTRMTVFATPLTTFSRKTATPHDKKPLPSKNTSPITYKKMSPTKSKTPTLRNRMTSPTSRLTKSCSKVSAKQTPTPKQRSTRLSKVPKQSLVDASLVDSSSTSSNSELVKMGKHSPADISKISESEITLVSSTPKGTESTATKTTRGSSMGVSSKSSSIKKSARKNSMMRFVSRRVAKKIFESSATAETSSKEKSTLLEAVDVETPSYGDWLVTSQETPLQTKRKSTVTAKLNSARAKSLPRLSERASTRRQRCSEYTADAVHTSTTAGNSNSLAQGENAFTAQMSADNSLSAVQSNETTKKSRVDDNLHADETQVNKPVPQQRQSMRKSRSEDGRPRDKSISENSNLNMSKQVKGASVVAEDSFNNSGFIPQHRRSLRKSGLNEGLEPNKSNPQASYLNAFKEKMEAVTLVMSETSLKESETVSQNRQAARKSGLDKKETSNLSTAEDEEDVITSITSETSINKSKSVSQHRQSVLDEDVHADGSMDESYNLSTSEQEANESAKIDTSFNKSEIVPQHSRSTRKSNLYESNSDKTNVKKQGKNIDTSATNDSSLKTSDSIPRHRLSVRKPKLDEGIHLDKSLPEASNLKYVEQDDDISTSTMKEISFNKSKSGPQLRRSGRKSELSKNARTDECRAETDDLTTSAKDEEVDELMSLPQHRQSRRKSSLYEHSNIDETESEAGNIDALEQDEEEVVTPVMTRNSFKKSKCVPQNCRPARTAGLKDHIDESMFNTSNISEQDDDDFGSSKSGLHHQQSLRKSKLNDSHEDVLDSEAGNVSASEQDNDDIVTPVMTHATFNNLLSVPKHRRSPRISRLDESVQTDESETPVVHETSRRCLAKKSTAKLQESLKLASLDDDENSKFAGSLSCLKVSLTSTPKAKSENRGVKRKFEASSSVKSYKRTKLYEVENKSSADWDVSNQSTASEEQTSKKSGSRLRLRVEYFSTDNSLLESTATSSILYESSFSKVKADSPSLSKKSPLSVKNTPTNRENINFSVTVQELRSPTANDVSGVEILLPTPAKTTAIKTRKAQASPLNDLTDVRGVKRLLRTPRQAKSPQNDLSDVRGVRRLMKTPRVQKSPKNDLTKVAGVKKLMQTPVVQSSPLNDLTDVRGVGKLMRTPKHQKSPKNDLSDVKGVKKMMETPREQRSPKNDLTEVFGVKKLMATPKLQPSPSNDLTDVRGVKKLMATPKLHKSPENNLSDVRGVKQLMRTPRDQKSPKNDLTHIHGVKKLMATPVLQKSPLNDLTDVKGVRKLMQTPKEPKSPENNLSNVRGVKKLLATPKLQRSPLNDLTDVSGVKKLFHASKHQRSPVNDLTNVVGVSELFSSAEESAFDRLVGRKPSKTYQRKVSPKKSTEALPGTSQSDEVKSDANPMVEEWITAQTKLLIQESSEQSTSEATYTEPPVQKKTTRGTRRAKFQGDAEEELTEPANAIDKEKRSYRTRRGKQNEFSTSDTPVKETRTRRGKNNPSVADTPVMETRTRRRKNDAVPVTPAVETKTQPEKTEGPVDVTPVKETRTRRAKNVVPDSATPVVEKRMGRRKNDSPASSTPVRETRARRRKAKDEDTQDAANNQEPLAQDVPSEIKPTRSRKAYSSVQQTSETDDISPKETPRRKRNKGTEQNHVTDKATGRTTRNMKKEITEKVEVDEGLSRAMRSRKRAVEQDTEENNKVVETENRRTRKTKADQSSTEKEGVRKTTQVDLATPVKVATRQGRSRKKIADEGNHVDIEVNKENIEAGPLRTRKKRKVLSTPEVDNVVEVSSMPVRKSARTRK